MLEAVQKVFFKKPINISMHIGISASILQGCKCRATCNYVSVTEGWNQNSCAFTYAAAGNPTCIRGYKKVKKRLDSLASNNSYPGPKIHSEYIIIRNPSFNNTIFVCTIDV